MTERFEPLAEAKGELVSWLARWAACIRRVDYAGARELFHPETYAFGTRTEVMEGLDDLVERQWHEVWPHADDFDFDLERLRCTVSDDARVACLMVLWTSTGYRVDGSSFLRAGRATIVLRRTTPESPWRAIHTHLSPSPGTGAATRRPHAAQRQPEPAPVPSPERL